MLLHEVRFILDPDNKVGTLHKHEYAIYDNNDNRSEMQIGTTLFTVISVESVDAKETAYDKVKKLIVNNTNSPAKVCVDYYPKV